MRARQIMSMAYERRNHLAHAPVSQIMHQPVHFATPDTLVQEVAGTMRRLRVGALPVVEDETVVGIVSEFDLLKVIEHLPSDQLAEALPGGE
ncbi:MAG: CBS domain-containing protein [Gemmatimonadales bacterium]